MKGYKIIDEDWTCDPTHKKPYQYACPGEFFQEDKPRAFYCGFHFAEKLSTCLSTHEFGIGSHVVEVEALGDVETSCGISCTNHLRIIRELSDEEISALVRNEFNNSTGDFWAFTITYLGESDIERLEVGDEWFEQFRKFV